MSYALELLDKMKDGHCYGISRELVENAVLEKDILVPGLLQELEYCIENHKSIDWDTYSSHYFALIILAGLEYKEAGELVTRLMSIENDNMIRVFEDFSTEEMPNIFCKIFQDDFESYRIIAENQNLDIWIRLAAIEGITDNVLNNLFPREKAIEYFRDLMINGPDRRCEFISWVVNSVFYIYPKELMDEILLLFQEGLVDPFITTYEEFVEAIATPMEFHLDRIRYNQNITFRGIPETLEFWWLLDKSPDDDNNENEEYDENDEFNYYDIENGNYREALEKLNYLRGVTVRNTAKPGRNEPCPCGSGKKYKKCCGKD